MAKKLTRDGKHNKSFKKKDEKDNFDIFENPSHGNRKPKERVKYESKPRVNKELRNQLLRDFNKANG